MEIENDDIFFIVFFMIVMFINIIVIFALLGLSNDLSNEVTILRQENTTLKWELEQVNQMNCSNDMLEYEVEQ